MQARGRTQVPSFVAALALGAGPWGCAGTTDGGGDLAKPTSSAGGAEVTGQGASGQRDAVGSGGDGGKGEGGGTESAGGETGQDDGSLGGGALPAPGSIGCRRDGDGKTTLVFVNGCEQDLTFEGSDIDGGTLGPGDFACVDVGSDSEPLSSKRYFGYIGRDPGPEHYTLAEFTFNTDFYDFDWYDISHVDAHNLPMQIVPVDRPDCDVLTCAESWLGSCPDVGRLVDEAGRVIACVSPDRDDPNSTVAQFFEACDDAYAWSGDDQQGDDPSPMRACAGEDWDVVFCPEQQ